MGDRTYRSKSGQWNGLANGAIAIVAGLAAVFLQWTQLTEVSEKKTNPQRIAKQEELRLKLFQHLPSFGFDNLIADWVFLRFIGYFGDEELGRSTSYALNDDYFEVITQRDPRFVDIYPFLSAAISIEQGNPELAGEYMDRGINALSPQIDPRGYLILRYKAIDQLLLQGDIPGTMATYHRIAEWLEQTSFRDSAQNFRNAAEFLRQNPDSILPRFWGWQYVYTNAVDEKVRQRSQQELLDLGAVKQEDKNGQVRFILPQEKELLEGRSPFRSNPVE